MKKSKSELRFSINIINYLDEIKKSENNIVLFGSVGNGKTSILNKLCGKFYQTADDGYSCTRNVQYDFSLKYDMVIIDFPGLNAVQDIIGHLKTQKTALSAIPIRMICFIIKYSPRNDDFERELGQMLYIFDNYISNITIIISKSEEITNKRKEEIAFLFKNKFGIGNIIFTTKKTNGYDLCEQFNDFKKKMENIKQIIVKTRDLAKTVPSLYNKDMAKEKEIFEDKFYDALDAFKKEVEKAIDPDLKRALYFAFKDYKDKLLEEYTNTIRNKKIDGKEPDIDSVVAEVLMFDNHIFNEFNEFRKSIESQIEVKSSDYNGEYNRFKRCPYCGIIWFKIKGCNTVVCGKRTKAEDKIIGKYKKYYISYVDNKIIISFEDLGIDMNPKKKKSPIPITKSKEVKSNQNNFYNSNFKKINNENKTQSNKMVDKPIKFNNSSSPYKLKIEDNLISKDNQNISNNNISKNNQKMNSKNQKNISKNFQINPKTCIRRSRIESKKKNFYDEFIGLTQKENLENVEREKEGKIKIKPFGCGRELNWTEMEDCSEEVISKLKEIAIDDYYSGLLDISEKFNKENTLLTSQSKP